MAGDWRSRARPVTRTPSSTGEAPGSDWRSRARPIAEPGTPLADALASQAGDVVTVETPSGPAQFTRGGERFYSPEEAAQLMDAGGARFREKALGAGLSFLSGGGPLLDELAGAAKALDPARLGAMAREALAGKTTPAVLDTYRQARDTARQDVARATRDTSPTLKLGGRELPVLPMAGAALPSILAPNPATVGARILSSGAQGAVAAAGNSEADLTRGQGGDFAGDVALGGGVGLGAGAVAEGLAAPLRWVAGKASGEARAAGEAARAQAQAAADKAVKSQEGMLGRVIATQGNAMETVMDVLNHPERFSEAEIQRALALLNSDFGKTLLSRAAGNNMTKLVEAVPVEEETRTALAAAREAALPESVARVLAQQRAGLGSDVATKAWKSIGQRALLGAAGSTLGAGAAWAVGADPKVGAGIGATAGFLPQGALQFMRNQAARPLVQEAVNNAGASAFEAGANALSRGGSAFSPLAQQRDKDAIDAFLTGG